MIAVKTRLVCDHCGYEGLWRNETSKKAVLSGRRRGWSHVGRKDYYLSCVRTGKVKV